MIKFFRKIRQGLLAENKFTKYLAYAFGEIILVVIGILIALGINSWYNAEKNEERIRAILVQAQSDILTDIKDAKRISSIYLMADSLSRNILNNKVTENTPLWQIDFTEQMVVDFNTNQSGYLRLVQNIENLPEKYNVLLPEFNFLYTVLQADIDHANDALYQIANDAEFNRIYSDPELADYMLHRHSRTEMANYYLQNPLFKNKVLFYVNAFGDLYTTVNTFSIHGMALYEKIDSVLGVQGKKIPEKLRLSPPAEIIEPYLGDYGDLSDTETDKPKGTLKFEDGLLTAVINGQPSKFYWIKDTFFFTKHGQAVFKFYTNDSGQRLLEVRTRWTSHIWKKVERTD